MRTGSGWELATEPEWDDTERNLMLALDEIERQTCRGCGGDLTVELTDKPPYEIPNDGHFHRIHALYCVGCVRVAKRARELHKSDEELRDTPADPMPEARRLVAERLPIPAHLLQPQPAQ